MKYLFEVPFLDTTWHNQISYCWFYIPSYSHCLVYPYCLTILIFSASFHSQGPLLARPHDVPKAWRTALFFFQVGVVKPKTAEIYGCSAPQNMGLSINDGAIWYPNSWMAKVENATGMMTGDTPQETSRLVAGSSWSPLAATDSSSEWSPNLKGGFRDHNLAQKPIEFMMTSINTAPNTNTKHPGLSGESVHLGVLQSSSSPC